MSNKKQSKMPMSGPPGMKNVEKAKNFKGTMKKLIKYMSKYKVGIIFVILFAIGSAVFTIFGPKILGNATTEIFNGLVSKIMGTGAGIDFDKVGKILLTLIGLYLLSLAFSAIQGVIMSGVTQKLSYNFRKQISEKINKLPMKYFETRTNGEILSRITNDVDTLSQNLNQSLTQIITSITVIIGVVIMMLSISPIMTLVAMFIFPIVTFITSIIVKKSQKYFKKQQEYLGHVNGEIEEIYGGHQIVKAFNGENKAKEKFNKLNNTLYSSAWKSQFLSGMMMPLMGFIGNLSYVIISIFGGWLTVKNKIQVGDILSFTQYIRTFTQQISQSSQVMNLLQATAAAAERVFEFLEEEEEVQIAENAIPVEKINGNVEFKNVKFGYDKEIIINNFNAKVKKGQKIAIVGPTGAGKTTIVKLLMRFYDVNSGEILLDGHNIKEFNRNELREAFGMVLQDTWLFNGSIRENIRYGRLEASDEEVEEAAKEAHVHHFIKTLPEGYDMEINEEASNISQGQKQLLTIARVILANPKILILDEATSSVDTRTEILIQNAMDKVMEGRTSFIIAHRLSTIRNADLILVMNHGDIIEQGTHDELLSKNGFYANLYSSQFDERIA